MHEYAFDIKLWAVCRVRAESEAAARKMLQALDCINVGYRYEEDADLLEITEASIEDEGGQSELFELDGEDV